VAPEHIWRSYLSGALNERLRVRIGVVPLSRLTASLLQSNYWVAMEQRQNRFFHVILRFQFSIRKTSFRPSLRVTCQVMGLLPVRQSWYVTRPLKRQHGGRHGAQAACQVGERQGSVAPAREGQDSLS
jgi:hypothetical protein